MLFFGETVSMLIRSHATITGEVLLPMRDCRFPKSSALAACLLAVCLATNVAARTPGERVSAQPLGIPVTDEFGQPIDVGLLVLGHSSSDKGDWPGRLAIAMNADVANGRNFVVHRVIPGGGGGFMWTQLSWAPDDLQYHRVAAARGSQYTEDENGNRISCRREMLERGLLGDIGLNGEICAPPLITHCVWHDAEGRHDEASDFKQCWDRMDVRLALIMDTSGRDWPLDDVDGDGVMTDTDYFLADNIDPAGHACGNGQAGVIDGFIDWNCDGRLSHRDAAHTTYSTWLNSLSKDLLDGFGESGVEHVFLMHKPIEVRGCDGYPDEPNCANHTLRAPTPDRPFDHFFSPYVYWEHSGVRALLEQSNLDPRIHAASPGDPTRLWQRSAACYAAGISPQRWAMHAVLGRPTEFVDADDHETHGLTGDSKVVGCNLDDHIHHNDAGGWMIADVWYESMRLYLAAPE